MYRIAICDDARHSCDILMEKLIDIAQQFTVKIEIDTYTNPKVLIKKMNNNPYFFDAIFIDIEFESSLEAKAGIELGRRIREEIENRLVHIIFFSRYNNLTNWTFVANPFDFMPKPLSDDKVLIVMNRLLDDYARTQKSFYKYTKNRASARVAASEIIYLTVNNRTIHMKTVREEEKFYGTLKDAYDQLEESGFAKISKNCMVNVNFIAKYIPTEVRMQTGEKFALNDRGFEEIERLCNIMNRKSTKCNFMFSDGKKSGDNE